MVKSEVVEFLLYGCATWTPKGHYNKPRVQMTSSRVGKKKDRLSHHHTLSERNPCTGLKTVGCGCTSCWGDLGAGSVEADVFYIPFIVSVQYIV